MTDAITREPIAGVPVQVQYRRFLELFSPKLDSSVTDAQGTAHLNACTNYSRGGRVVVFAFTNSDYVLDEPVPRSYVQVPMEEIGLQAKGPFRVDVRVISMAEYRRRYRN